MTIFHTHFKFFCFTFANFCHFLFKLLLGNVLPVSSCFLEQKNLGLKETLLIIYLVFLLCTILSPLEYLQPQPMFVYFRWQPDQTIMLSSDVYKVSSYDEQKSASSYLLPICLCLSMHFHMTVSNQERHPACPLLNLLETKQIQFHHNVSRSLAIIVSFTSPVNFVNYSSFRSETIQFLNLFCHSPYQKHLVQCGY